MSGLLLLTQSPAGIISSLPKILTATTKYVTKTLYVHLDFISRKTNSDLHIFSRVIKDIYSISPKYCGNVDIRVILTGFKCPVEIPSKTQFSVDNVFVDLIRSDKEGLDLEKRYISYLRENKLIVLLDKSDSNSLVASDPSNTDKLYNHVVAGGTFDHIHAGHKILLSEALLRCKEKFTLGVTDTPLLKNKFLNDLIQPVDDRILKVKNFVTDIDPSLIYDIVPIQDPIGPAGSDPTMDMIVVSEETKKGGGVINTLREEKKLNPLDIHVINLVEDELRTENEEFKISSSSLRIRQLGTLISEPSTDYNLNEPYIIGLTGGSASGKSTICKHLNELGAGIINCDALGHLAYKKGSSCYLKLIKQFSDSILDSEGEINRGNLGAIVFSNKDNLQHLNDIVWPEIATLANAEIERHKAEGKKVVVLDAAVLLEAGWDKFCNQIWVSFVNEEEAVKRIQERDNKTKEAAEQRIRSQMKNKERIKRANVVFSSQPPLYTKSQVEIAWKNLTQFLNLNKL